MSKVKLILLGMLAVLAVSAVASATAEAKETIGFWDCQPHENGHWENSQCTKAGPPDDYETEEIRETKAEGTSQTSELAGKLLGISVLIRCEKDTFTATLKAGGASEGEVKFTGCRVLTENESVLKERPECIVKEPIEFKFTDRLIETGKQAFSDEFKGILESGKTFVEITIENKGTEKCPVADTAKVTGTQTCPIPKAEEPLVTHEIVCTPTGSNLELGGKPAKFTSTEKVKLDSGQDWGSA